MDGVVTSGGGSGWCKDGLDRRSDGRDETVVVRCDDRRDADDAAAGDDPDEHRCREAGAECAVVVVDGARAVLEAAPAAKVVCLTASVTQQEIEEVLAAGAVACVTKDQDFDRLVEVVRRAAAT